MSKATKNNAVKSNKNVTKRSASNKVMNYDVKSIKNKLRTGEINLIAARTGVSASQVSNVFAGRRSDNNKIIATASKMTARR